MLHGVCLGRVLLQLTVKDSRQVDAAWSVPWEIIITVKVKDSRQVEIYMYVQRKEAWFVPFVILTYLPNCSPMSFSFECPPPPLFSSS